jgi:hypothetical protein
VNAYTALYQLIDSLPECLWPEAERYLKALNTEDPVLRTLLLAPPEDEELSDDEAGALAEAEIERASGTVRYVDHDSLRRELGWS